MALTKQGADNYSGTHILIALVFGLVLGGFTTPIWQYLGYLALPKDKADISKKFSSMENRIQDQLDTIDRQSNEIVQLKTSLNESSQALKNSKAETEQAKTATPRRYEVVKEGSLTWRLDTATGKTCLLLASEADWTKPTMASQNCDRTQ